MDRFLKKAAILSTLIVTSSVQAACPIGWKCVPPKVGPWIYKSPLRMSGPYAGGWLSEAELQAAEIKHQHDVEKACSTSFPAYDYVNRNYVFDGQIESTAQTSDFYIASTYYWDSGCASGSRSDRAHIIRTRSVGCGIGQGTDGTYCALGTVIPDKNKGGGGCSTSNGAGSVGSVFVGNPINIGVGNKFQREVDIYKAGQSPLQLERSYNSIGGSVAYVQSVGGNWLHNYQSTIGFSSLADVSVAFAYRSDGRVIYFYYKNGIFSADADESYKITRGVNAQGATTGWAIMNPAGQIESYDGNGRLLLIVGRAGLSQRLIYDANHLARVEDDFGRSLVFDYSTANGYPGAGLIYSVTDPVGYKYKYLYDSSFYLKTVTFPDEKTRTYLYNELAYTSNVSIPSGALTGIVDENESRFATFNYDGAGRAISTEHAGGADKYSVAYTSLNQVSKVTNPGGAIHTYALGSYLGVVKMTGQSPPAGSGCLASSNTLTYDTNGNKASEDDFNGHRTCSAYSTASATSVGNLEITRVEGLTGGANGTVCSTVVGSGASLPAGSRKISTAWHPQWALKTQQAEPLRKTTWVYNGQTDPFNNNQTASCASVTANYGTSSSATLPDGSPIAVLCKKVEQATDDQDGSQGLNATLSTADAGAVAQRQWSYTYNQYGQVLTSTDPLGVTTTYNYYLDTSFTGTAPNEQGHTQGDLQSVSNPLGHTTTYTLYDRAGRVLSMSDPNGLQTTYSYWPRGWIKSVNVGGLASNFDYWPTGLLKKATQPDGSYLYYVYDDAHRLTDITDQVDGSGTITGNRVHYTLDNAGNRLAEDVKDSSATLTRTIARTYDALNRLQTITGSAQ